MVRIVIVRHGQTDGNRLKEHSGHYEHKLDELGIRQAECSAKYVLENFKIDRIYSSDLSRACDTAMPVAKALDLEIEKRASLREIDVGRWAGRKRDEIDREEPELRARFRAEPWNVRPGGGEHYSELMDRAVSEIHRIAEDNDGKTVLVATHYGVIWMLYCYVNGIPLEKMRSVPQITNASISVLEYENGKFEFTMFAKGDHVVKE